MGQRAGLRCVNDDHQGIPHGPSLTEKIWSSAISKELFLMPLVCWPPSLCSSLLPFYSRFSPPDWGFQGRYLSHPPLPPVVGVVVRTKKYGCVRYKALNTIKSAFLCTLSFYLSSFSTFVLSLPCGTVWSFAIGVSTLLSSAISIRGGVFLWTGPLA